MCSGHYDVFCSPLTSCFPGMLLTHFLNGLEIVPAAPVITGITFVFKFYMRCISVVRYLYFRIFSASFLITFLSPELLLLLYCAVLKRLATPSEFHIPLPSIALFAHC